MTTTATTAAAVQRRTLWVLVVVQTVGAIGVTIGIATASLLARDLSGSEKQAGLAQTFQVFGTAIAAYGLAKLAAVRGRRAGMVTGYLLGALGGLLAVLSGVVGSMPVLLAGAVLLGAISAVNAGARYAATDLADDAHRARALSLVVWAATLGAVIGPNLTKPAAEVADLVGIPALTGPFALGFVGVLVAAVLAWVLLRPDPLLLARELAGVTAPAAEHHRRVGTLVHLRERPILAAAALGLATAHAVMVAVMVMTPLHMEHGGAGLEIIGLVISVHVLGMFGFAPLVGVACDRLGRDRLLWAGGVTLLVSLALCGRSPEGESWQIMLGLFLLGLGWSFATVAASALIADHAPLTARAEIQGATDMAMNLAAAGGGGLAGWIVGTAGYPMLNLFAAVLATGVLLSGAAAWRYHPD